MPSPDDSDDTQALGVAWTIRSHERRITAPEPDRAVLFRHRGTTGALAELTAQLEAIDKRVSSIEQLRWKLAGAVILAGSLTGVILFVLSRLLEH